MKNRCTKMALVSVLAIAPTTNADKLNIYGDQLQNGLQNWSWKNTYAGYDVC